MKIFQLTPRFMFAFIEKFVLGKGKRLIICHIGSEDGFLPDALWAFESKKTGDYHEEMDGVSFENWFSKILPNLEENSVVVLDNASYHTRKLEKIPTMATRKAGIQEWLTSKNIDFDETMVKAELLQIVKEHKNKYNLNIIDEMAKKQNKTILRLPPYHCELNPIELIWADVKQYVAVKNKTFKFSDVKNIFHEAIQRITPDKWKKCIQHVEEKVETKMWNIDIVTDVQVEPLIINVDDSGSSMSSDGE